MKSGDKYPWFLTPTSRTHTMAVALRSMPIDWTQTQRFRSTTSSSTATQSLRPTRRLQGGEIMSDIWFIWGTSSNRRNNNFVALFSMLKPSYRECLSDWQKFKTYQSNKVYAFSIVRFKVFKSFSADLATLRSNLRWYASTERVSSKYGWIKTYQNTIFRTYFLRLRTEVMGSLSKNWSEILKIWLTLKTWKQFHPL